MEEYVVLFLLHEGLDKGTLIPLRVHTNCICFFKDDLEESE